MVIWLIVLSSRKGIFSTTKILTIFISCFVLRDWKIVIDLYISNALLCLLFSQLVAPECSANDYHDKIRLDSEVEEDFSYESDIYEIGFDFGDICKNPGKFEFFLWLNGKLKLRYKLQT